MIPFASLAARLPFARTRPETPEGARVPDAYRFALGTRGVADAVAPGAAEVARDHLRLDRQYARTLAVTATRGASTPGGCSPWWTSTRRWSSPCTSTRWRAPGWSGR